MERGSANGVDPPEEKKQKPIKPESESEPQSEPQSEQQMPLPLELITLITKNLCLSKKDIASLWSTSKEFRKAVELSAAYRETMRPTLEHREHVKAFTEQIQGRSERLSPAYRERCDAVTKERIEKEDEEIGVVLIQLLKDASDSWYNDTDKQIPREVRGLQSRLFPTVNNHGLDNDLLFRDAVKSARLHWLNDLLTAVCTHLTHVTERPLVQGAKQTLQSELPGVELYLHKDTKGEQVISVGTPENHVYRKLPTDTWRRKWQGTEWQGTAPDYIFADCIKAILMVPCGFSIGDEVQVSGEGGVVNAKVKHVHANGSVDVVYHDKTEGKLLTPEKDDLYMLRAAFDDTALD